MAPACHTLVLGPCYMIGPCFYTRGVGTLPLTEQYLLYDHFDLFPITWSQPMAKPGRTALRVSRAHTSRLQTALPADRQFPGTISCHRATALGFMLG
jgi:hypothetical protein